MNTSSTIKKSLQLISLIILCAIVVLQMSFLLPQILKDLYAINKNYWQPVIWRSVNYAANQALADYVFSGYYFSLLIIIYSLLRKKQSNHIPTGLATLGCATIPIIFVHATLSYANLPFSYYFFVASIILATTLAKFIPFKLISWQNQDLMHLTVSGLFFSAAAWTRPEGIFFAWLILIVITAILIAITKQKNNYYLTFFSAAPLFLYQLFFYFLQKWLSTTTAINLTNKEISVSAITQLVSSLLQQGWNAANGIEVLNHFYHLCVSSTSWGLFGLLLLLSFPSFFVVKKKVNSSQTLSAMMLLLLISWVFILAMLFSYYFMSLAPIGEKDLSFWLNVGMDRMLMPAVVLLWSSVVGIWSSYLTQSSEVTDHA